MEPRDDRLGMADMGTKEVKFLRYLNISGKETVGEKMGQSGGGEQPIDYMQS